MGILGTYFIYFPNLKKERILFVLIGVLWCLFPAIRSQSVGTDTMSYISYFLHPQLGYNGDQVIEYGFQFWNWIIRSIYKNLFFYIFMSAVLSCPIKLYIIRKTSKNSILTLFFVSTIVFLEPFIFTEYGIMRQTISISFFMCLVYAIIFNLRKYYIIFFAILSFLFHGSSLLPILILFIVYFFRIKISRKTFLICLLSTFIYGVSLINIFKNILSMLSFLKIEQLRYIDILTNELDTGYNYYVNTVPLVIIGIFILVYYPKKEKNEILFQLSMWGIILTNIFISIPIGQRITYCFIPIICITLAKIVRKSNYLYLLPLFLFYFYRLYSFYLIQNSGIQKLGDGNVIFPYSTFLN